MVKSYNDPIKQKSRERERNFIARNLLKERDPKDVKIVCFPGAEIEGEEALEVIEVYDLLGIPRENIIGLEYNPRSAERLRKADMGIEVICEDALEFFKSTDKSFDIINLDYTGHRTWKERDTARYIVGKGTLRNGGLFMTNHCIKRESNQMKANYLDRSCFIDKSLIDQEINFEKEEVRKSIKKGEFNLDELRDHGITIDNLRIFGGGRGELYPETCIFTNRPKYSKLVERIRELNPDLIAPSDPLLGNYKGIEGDINWTLNKTANLSIYLDSVRKCSKHFNISERESMFLLGSIMGQRNRVKLPRAIERYSYTSNKNTNMLLDLIKFGEIPSEIADKVNELGGINSSQNGFHLNYLRYKPQLFKRKLRNVKNIMETYFVNNMQVSSPIYLGSSYHPPKRKESISKEDAVEFLQDGCSPREISEIYKGFSKGQLAALKAHYVTMGKTLK